MTIEKQLEEQLEEEIITLANLYRETDLDVAKKCYDQYVYSILNVHSRISVNKSFKKQTSELYDKLKIK